MKNNAIGCSLFKHFKSMFVMFEWEVCYCVISKHRGVTKQKVWDDFQMLPSEQIPINELKFIRVPKGSITTKNLPLKITAFCQVTSVHLMISPSWIISHTSLNVWLKNLYLLPKINHYWTNKLNHFFFF